MRMKLFDLRGRRQPLPAALVNHAIEPHGLLGGAEFQTPIVLCFQALASIT